MLAGHVCRSFPHEEGLCAGCAAQAAGTLFRGWIGDVGARLAFAVAAGNGEGPAIARFSVANQITGSAAWVAALVMIALADVLTRPASAPDRAPIRRAGKE